MTRTLVGNRAPLHRPPLFLNCTGMHRTLVGVALLVTIGCDARDSEYESSRIEGRTAAVANGAALYALRLWSAPELDSLGRAGVRIDSIVVTPVELRMRPGETVPLSVLSVVAIDPQGRTLPAAPILLEIDTTVIALTPENVVARSRGRAHVHVRGLLPTSSGGEASRAIVIRVE